MARVTVEDCVEQLPNRFELVLVAAKRARRLATGAAQSSLDWENDKPTVLALREIAAGCKFEEVEETETTSSSNALNISTSRRILGPESAFS